MGRGLGEGCAGRPAGADGVVRGVEGAVEAGAGGAEARERGGVEFGVAPVLIVGAEGVRSVGEGDADFEAISGELTRVATSSRVGCAEVTTRTETPSTVNELVRIPPQRSRVCVMSLRS